jgi:hypothetical protein
MRCDCEACIAEREDEEEERWERAEAVELPGHGGEFCCAACAQAEATRLRMQAKREALQAKLRVRQLLALARKSEEVLPPPAPLPPIDDVLAWVGGEEEGESRGSRKGSVAKGKKDRGAGRGRAGSHARPPPAAPAAPRESVGSGGEEEEEEESALYLSAALLGPSRRAKALPPSPAPRTKQAAGGGRGPAPTAGEGRGGGTRGATTSCWLPPQAKASVPAPVPAKRVEAVAPPRKMDRHSPAVVAHRPVGSSPPTAPKALHFSPPVSPANAWAVRARGTATPAGVDQGPSAPVGSSPAPPPRKWPPLAPSAPSFTPASRKSALPPIGLRAGSSAWTSEAQRSSDGAAFGGARQSKVVQGEDHPDAAVRRLLQELGLDDE